MDLILDSQATDKPVSAATKHIRLYSNNPMHDCIDRIIDACSCIDEGRSDAFEHLIELQKAAEQLDNLALQKIFTKAVE
jgi:hypothetical protein